MILWQDTAGVEPYCGTGHRIKDESDWDFDHLNFLFNWQVIHHLPRKYLRDFNQLDILRGFYTWAWDQEKNIWAIY